jgi:hypothetical protein
MKDVTGAGCNKNGAPIRDDLPLHDLTGGNTFIPSLLPQIFPGEVDGAALDAAILRARDMLKKAATFELLVTPNGTGFTANVKVINETGHKLPSGYPEGRRMWINLKAFDLEGSLLYESGNYDFNSAILDHDADIKIYEIKPGPDTDIASLTGLPAAPSFHFVLNNKVYSDNRIPPRGFTNANFEAIQSPPIGYSYADGQYWDNTQYSLPETTYTVEATLYYQTLSKEYVEFLRDENVTDQSGQIMYDLWNNNGKSSPELMNTTTFTIDIDSDSDGILDLTDNCPNNPNSDQIDFDTDGFGAACDCNDAIAAVNPAAIEVCDGIDNNCDGQVDEGVLTTWYADTDSDGFGDLNTSQESCTQPIGYVDNSSDCDDTDPAINPNTVWFEDTDNDTFGNPSVILTQCVQPGGYILNNQDCNDTDAAVNPDAIEVCDDIDNNCDGQVDEGLLTTWYADSDSDGFGDLNNTQDACSLPPGFVDNSTDCDDTDPAINPNTVWYADADNDSFGDINTTLTQCDTPVGYVLNDLDCNDGNVSINPAAIEVFDSIDNDCNGDVDEGFTDADADGYALEVDDCDDTNEAINPGATEVVASGIDANCDGLYLWYVDADKDGYGSISTILSVNNSAITTDGESANSDDCNDDDAGINPNTVWFEDSDLDTYGNPSLTLTQCEQPPGYVLNDQDCNDGDATVNPLIQTVMIYSYGMWMSMMMDMALLQQYHLLIVPPE